MKKGYVFCCDECESDWPAFFMLHDDLWLSIASKKEMLCINCTERRLGRRITKDDLNADHPTNKAILYFLQ